MAGCMRDPASAVLDDARAWLIAPIAYDGLLELFQWRWQSAAETERWELIADELFSLYSRWQNTEPGFFGRLQVIAAEITAWSTVETARRAYGACRKQLNEAHHIHAELKYELDRLDQLDDMRAQCGNLRQNDEAVWRVIRLCWLGPPARAETELLALAEDLACDLDVALTRLTALRGKSTTLLSYLNDCWSRLRQGTDYSSWQRTQQSMQELARNFVARSGAKDYPSFRGLLLKFCVAESISPAEIAAVLVNESGLPLFADEALPTRLEKDLALQTVYNAYEAFWIDARRLPPPVLDEPEQIIVMP